LGVLNGQLDTRAIRPNHLTRITVGTKVQPKNITHPTDAKLLYKALVQLNALARREGITLCQSYLKAQIIAAPYAHAHQLKQ